MLLGFGFVVGIVGLVLVLNVARLGDYVIAHLTSRSLGALAPGFAATPAGFRVYGWLIVVIGLAVVSFDAVIVGAAYGLFLLSVTVVLFVVLSIRIIWGEIRTFRALKR